MGGREGRQESKRIKEKRVKVGSPALEGRVGLMRDPRLLFHCFWGENRLLPLRAQNPVPAKIKFI